MNTRTAPATMPRPTRLRAGALLAAGVLLAVPAARAQRPPSGLPEGAMPAAPMPADTAPAAPPADGAPPAEGSPPAAQGNPGEVLPDGTYVIKKGDTLWDLSQQFLSNPWYWPKIWADNPYIENPHWIYPTQKLKIRQGGEGLPAQVAGAPGDEEREGPSEEPEALPARPAEIADFTTGSMDQADSLGQDADLVSVSGERHLGVQPRERVSVRVTQVISSAQLEETGVITGSFEEKGMLANYDQCYVRFADLSKVHVGDTFTVFRPAGAVTHPITHASYGYLSNILGTMKIVGKEGEAAVGILSNVQEDVARGDRVGPATSLEKTINPRPSTREVTGTILATVIPNLAAIGEAHVVFLDKGSRDGVAEGDVFQVVHWGDGLGKVLKSAMPEDENLAPPANVPREVVATLVVFDTSPSTATAMVVKSLREVIVGDRVEMRPTARPAGAGGGR